MTDRFQMAQLRAMKETQRIWEMFNRCAICGETIKNPLAAIPSTHRPNRIIHRITCVAPGRSSRES